jgi:hypothetical protein
MRDFALADYDTVLALWRSCEGIGLSDSDTREAIATYLARNPGLSLVATDADGVIVGAVLGGHDGRRGYLHHLAVAPAHRGGASVASGRRNARPPPTARHPEVQHFSLRRQRRRPHLLAARRLVCARRSGDRAESKIR